MNDLGATVDQLGLLADPTRLRLLSLLGHSELSVVELTKIMAVPQSRISTHLGKLRGAGLLRDRKVGASTRYCLATADDRGEAHALWQSVRRLLDDRVLEADTRRCEAVTALRDRDSGWPDEVAGQMERHYSPGRTWEATARALAGLLRLGDVLDVGSGDGVTAQLIAARARSVTCVDRSARVLEAARQRLSPLSNVRLVEGDMHALPFSEASFDEVLHLHALTYAEDPGRAVAEAARVLRPGGVLMALTLAGHDHGEVASGYGHVHPGFSPATLAGWAEAAGLRVERCAVTSRERRPPGFEVVSLSALKPNAHTDPFPHA